MGVSKVDYNGDTLIDLSNDSVTPETLALGETAHNSNGDIITGTMVQSVGTDDDVYIIPVLFDSSEDRYENEMWATEFRDAMIAGKKIYARVNAPDVYDYSHSQSDLLIHLNIINIHIGNSDEIYGRALVAEWVINSYFVKLNISLQVAYNPDENGITESLISCRFIARKLSYLTLEDVDSRGVKIYKVKTVKAFGGLCCEDFITTTDGVETYSGFYRDVKKKINTTNYQYVMLYIGDSTIAGKDHLHAFYSHQYRDDETKLTVYCFKSESENETLLLELHSDESLTYTTINKFLTNEEINEIIGITVD